MGTGKTTLARILAERWRRPFFDTDTLIEQHVKMSVSDFFSKHGEAAFRELERECVEKWLPPDGAVIACGGGLVTGCGMPGILRQKGIVVCLFASAETIYRRICHSSHRPLLQCENPLERIRELLASREAAYVKSGSGIFTDGRNFLDLANSIERMYSTAVASRPNAGPGPSLAGVSPDA